MWRSKTDVGSLMVLEAGWLRIVSRRDRHSKEKAA